MTLYGEKLESKPLRKKREEGGKCPWQFYFLLFHLEKKNQEIMAALQYKPQPQWKMGKKIQAAAYNGVRTVNGTYKSI